MKIETAVKLAKPFVGSLKTAGERPILKSALVTGEYVIATNSHFLIRIKHDETINPHAHYLHHYKKEITEHLDAKSYPKTDRLIPDPNYANSSGTLDTKEMFEAIQGAAVAGEFNHKVDYENAIYENSQLPKQRRKGKDTIKTLTAPKVVLTEDKAHVKAFTKEFRTGEYTYTFDSKLPLQETTFNVDYLKTIFKTFKAAKEPEIKAHWTSNMRPWYLVAGDIEIIILPVRTW